MPSRRVPTYFSHGTKILLLAHSLFWMSAHLLIPFMGIFFVEELEGVTLTEVGISSLIFFLSFGLLEPVMGMLADKIKGFKDELFFVSFGYVARGIVFMCFALAATAWHLYIFQFFLGIFRAISGPADKVLYAKYMKQRQSATLWGLDESMVNLSAALGSGLGGYFLYVFGFRTMFMVTGALTVLAGLCIFLLFPGKKS